MRNATKLIWRGLVLAVLAAGGAGARAGEPGVACRFGAQGLEGLDVGGQAWLSVGQPKVVRAVFETTSHDENGYLKYEFETKAEEASASGFDAAKKAARAEYPWGSLEVVYAPAPGRLDLTVTLRNGSAKLLADFEVELLGLKLPAVPANWKKGKVRPASGLDNLAATWIEDEAFKAVFCALTMDPPSRFGLKPGADAEVPQYTLIWAGGVNKAEPGAYELKPRGVPRIAPGASFTFECTLRAMPAGADRHALMEDVYERFRKAYGPVAEWKDRRPIGMLMRSSSYKGHKSETNPRGWFSNPKLDIADKAAFKAAALADAERCVKTLQAMDAQGFVFWDVEGSENPHPITYIGDPRLAEKLAPEFDEVADAYFQAFRDAGLATGICIRPTQVYFNAEKKKWDHGTCSDGGPGRGDYFPQLRPKEVPWWRFYPIVERLCAKIEYAQQRWGCTIFYIDTNGSFRQFGEEQKFEWMLLDQSVWKAVKEKHPEVLLIPELVGENFAWHAANWSCTAAYMELDLNGFGTHEGVRRLLPGAFSIVNVCDGDFAKHREKLAAAVKAGDILLSHGWFGSQRNKEVKELYDEVVRGIKPVVVEPPKKSEADLIQEELSK
ncbi:MAG: hypothetical protein M5U26_19045 [Planctomycetota bacterium]|nr:hypothetical protein [Planctomycetota bacterium]